MKSICARMGGMCDGSMRCDTCFYYTRTFKAEVEDMTPEVAERFGLVDWKALYKEATRSGMYETMLEIAEQRDDMAETLFYLASRFEEVCGELAYAEAMRERDNQGWAKTTSGLIPDCPDNPQDYAFVHAHWRPKPRRSKSVSNSPTPTTEIPPAVSESPASLQGQPEASKDGVTLWYCEVCGKPTDIYPCRVSGGVPTSDDVVRDSPAVCRWEVGRWGI